MRNNKSHYFALEDTIFDSRIPLRSEEEFRAGITFAAKLVGSGNVARPNSRTEIVAAMRKIRADCRTRKDKKRKVIITVSYEGVKVTLENGKKSISNLSFSNHPIHRIFYVSHDSLDLHIFSYIVREGNTFKCLVFKSPKQTLAVNVVRTIGQAFELCHKKSLVNENANSVQITNSNRPLDYSNQCETDIKCTQIKGALDLDDKPNLSNNQMGQIIRDVDNKLDKLADKVVLLEKQISILLECVEVRHKERLATVDCSGKQNDINSCNNGGKEKKLLLEEFKCLDGKGLTKASDTINEDKPYLNSPDSLLSSPVLNCNSTGSCLLFNDLY